jgi:hypothetical protein
MRRRRCACFFALLFLTRMTIDLPDLYLFADGQRMRMSFSLVTNPVFAALSDRWSTPHRLVTSFRRVNPY